VEWTTTGPAADYISYFGAAAGDPAQGYYSYDLGDWHIVALNSNIDMTATSAQVQWLQSDLANSTKRCTLAYFHFPRFYSTPTAGGSTVRSAVKPLWDALYAAGAEVIVNSQVRSYERFAPMNPAGTPDPTNGIREFIVGTGGTGLNTISVVAPNSEVLNSSTFGIIKFSLSATGYTWQFVPIAGKTFTDSGSGTCH
jgi:acid phosphatase type 7